MQWGASICSNVGGDVRHVIEAVRIKKGETLGVSRCYLAKLSGNENGFPFCMQACFND